MKLIIFTFLFSTITLVAQTEDRRNPVERNNLTRIFSRGQSFTFDGITKLSKGSLYLNERWEGRSILVTKDGQNLKFKNLNFNVDTQIFESKFKEEICHKIDFAQIDYVLMNNKKFKALDYKGDTKVFEFLFESEDVSILKSYALNVKAASSNPMVNRNRNIYTIRNSFYTLINGDWSEIRLSRKHVLKVLQHKASNDEVEDFVRSNNLDYKKEFDLKMILDNFLKKRAN